MSSTPGKFASTVKVGPKGQIVIPKPARDLFGIKPGDILLLLADVERGIAIVREDLFKAFPEGPAATGETDRSHDSPQDEE